MESKRDKLIKLLHEAKSYASNMMMHSDIDDVIDTSYDELQAEYLLKNGVEVKKKMKDNEIIKALECCSAHDWQCDEECPFYSRCSKYLMSSGALNIINRQKAEIKRLNNCCAGLQNERDAYKNIVNEAVDEAKSEAIKEFAERLNYKIVNTSSVFTVQKATHEFLSGNAHRQHEILDYINTLVEEMTEEEENA